MKKGWEWKRLGDVCQIRGGGTPSKSETSFWRGHIPWVSPKDMKCDVVHDTIDHISDQAVRESTTSLVPAGSLLVVVRSGILERIVPIAIAGRELALNQDLKAICPSPDVDERFLFFFLHSQMHVLLSKVGRSATVHKLNTEHLKELQIPVPPLPEQRRIVGILDEAFAGLATAEANAARNLQNAREIFDSHLHAVFSQRGATRPPVPLRQCVEDIATGPFGSLLHKSDYEVGGIPLVNPINIEGEAIVPDDRKAVGRETAERLSRYVLKENDVVIGRRGEIGRCAVITSVEAGWICGTGCFVIRPTADTNPHYLAHLLRSKPYREQLEAVSERATMPSISNEDLGNLDIRIPPLPQQKMVLRSLNLVSAETQRVATLQQRKIVALGELKKSLLHQAFSGGL